MLASHLDEIEAAKAAAVEVLLNNASGPFQGLPRTAAWGYPEPYTRDLLLSVLGIAVTGNEVLLKSMRTVLETLAVNQTPRGHIPSMVHNPDDRGASDTTPLFLVAVAIFRELIHEPDFLSGAVEKALTWMAFQSPSDQDLVAQQPTSDWRDEQWVLGYGLFVNTLLYTYLRLLGHTQAAEGVRDALNQFTLPHTVSPANHHEGLVVMYKPYFALWSYKVLSSEGFDLLGNSLAILSGIASPTRARDMVTWIEAQCEEMRLSGVLVGELPPNYFPFILPGDPDWHPRYALFNQPGEYHNGGMWPFVAGMYIAALVAAKRYRLAEEKLVALTRAITLSRSGKLDFGFNEWHKAQTGLPMGQDWQTWSASMYLYAAACVQNRFTPFFDEMRTEAFPA